MLRSLLFLATFLATSTLALTASAAVFTGNGETGFGGALGNGSIELAQVGTTDVIQGTFTTGAALNNVAVLYLDTTAGGFNSTATFTDNADGGRTAISGFNNNDPVDPQTTVTFAPGFEADYALNIESGFAGTFLLDDPTNFTFGVDAGIAETAPGSGVFNFSFALGDIGLAAGDSFDLVGTLISGTGFRSDEAIGDGVAAGNPGFAGDIAFTNSLTVTTVSAVPEPSSMALLAIGATAVGIRRRRSRS